MRGARAPAPSKPPSLSLSVSLSFSPQPTCARACPRVHFVHVCACDHAYATRGLLLQHVVRSRRKKDKEETIAAKEALFEDNRRQLRSRLKAQVEPVLELPRCFLLHVPREVFAIPGLSHLCLGHNCLTGLPMVDSPALAHSLRHLDLSNNQLDGATPRCTLAQFSVLPARAYPARGLRPSKGRHPPHVPRGGLPVTLPPSTHTSPPPPHTQPPPPPSTRCRHVCTSVRSLQMCRRASCCSPTCSTCS